MKYTCEVVIDLPREKIIPLFDNADNLLKWQSGLKSFEHLSGEPGQVGAKSRLIFDEGGRKVEMIETITVRNLPDEFSGTYQAKGVDNWVSNRFIDEGEKTRWLSESEFKFSGVMRFLAVLMGGSFRKQTLDFMNSFKKFAEEESAAET